MIYQRRSLLPVCRGVFFSALLLALVFFNAAIAMGNLSQDITPEVAEITETEEFSVDPSLLLLINSIKLLDNSKGTQSIKYAQEHLLQFSSPKSPLNPAEQYLYLLAQALLIEKKTQLQPPTLNKDKVTESIVALLVEAKNVGEVIDEGQLSQPIFLQLHEILANKYAELGQYDLAYQEKREYLIKYDIYRDNKRNAMLSALTEEFSINEKKSLNDSLIKQNQQQVQRVDEAQKEKKMQQTRFILVMAIALAFGLLFFWQLKVRNKLIVLTKTDALTGIFNRSALFEHGHTMAKRFSEQPYDLSILLLDIDHFKKINDVYGHHCGDQVLKTIASLVNETMRTRDIFARLGGEEFVALLPLADSSKAKAIAQRINEKVAQYDFGAIGLKEQVTLSIGISTMDYHNASFEDALHSADLAMYQAKAQGRNCVLSYQNISTSQERRGI
ncbi:GGDEF domain-containing protein [Colwellia sp. D2M02]|uniref:GGDEF domain-containing protein n=1 Tax=Colwellia sp. D2M02 TaxID=2841562 RepID=UPI001C08B857|nr:GGDEF domain-containing protein [Colwellia sp. D2M02]MBU2893359.1 GGDEF domain-containing protein [Colwellia sp. D2M02]